MKELTLEEIHKYSLGCLIYFDKICQKHGLRYSLAFGSLIGAFRHKGFIPWDDDIDVVMMREDYEKLERLFFDDIEHDEIYGFMNEKNNEQYHYTIGRIVDKRTCIRFTSDEGDVDDMGVFIDVYPVDYIPESLYARKIIHFFMVIILMGLAVNTNKVNHYVSATRWKRWVIWMLTCLLRLIGKKKIYSFYHLLLKLLPKKSPYVDELWDMHYFMDLSFRAEWFEAVSLYEFEGHQFYGFCEADTFLRNHYGDYMVVRSKSGMKPHHHYKAYFLGACDGTYTAT